MSATARNRASQRAARPEGVTDPLLWDLAIDVAAAHQPDETGSCPNPQCADQAGPCAASVNAERALRLAGATPSAQLRARGRTGATGAGEYRDAGRRDRAAAGPADRDDPALPHRMRGAGRAA